MDMLPIEPGTQRRSTLPRAGEQHRSAVRVFLPPLPGVAIECHWSALATAA